jgi:transposase
MDTVRTRTVAPPERRRLHWMKRQLANAVNASHARIILLSSGGVCNREIACRVDRCPSWVRKIIHRFNSQGLEGITWYPWMQVRNEPRKFVADVVEEIVEVALSPPKQLIGLTQWSLAKLRSYLLEQGIIPGISLDWLRTLLVRRGIRWRRTKTWKESHDPDFYAKYRKIRRLYSRRPARGRRICVDEFGPLSLKPRHGACLAGASKRVDRLRATYHRTSGVRHWFAAYDLESGRLCGCFAASKAGPDFLKFLKWLRRRYRHNETLHLVLDNYATHGTAAVETWAKKHHVRFYFTPTDASWLNRIEAQFTPLKKFALDNSDYRSHDELQQAIDTYIAWQNRQRPITVTAWNDYQKQRRAA